jgi:hypothetical protein
MSERNRTADEIDLATPIAGPRVAADRVDAARVEAPVVGALMKGLTGLLLMVGFLVRLLPLVQGRALLMRQPSEDGYLMLTAARYMALGLGLSTADGTIPTNGVQPLAAFIDVLCFVLARGDRTIGVALVMALSLLVSLLALVAVYRLAVLVFARFPAPKILAAFTAALWFASPLVIPHSTNALETGIYLLIIAVTCRYFIVNMADPEIDLPWSKAAVFGLLLGASFWARNDAVFLAVALMGARLYITVGLPMVVLYRRVREMILSGVVMAAVAAPWMINNAVRFGSVIPISGKAEAAKRLGTNVLVAPTKLTEYISVVIGIPQSLEDLLPVKVACLAFVLAVAALVAKIARDGDKRTRALCIFALMHTAQLAIYYGIFFGAGHFMARYMAPVSMLSAFLIAGLSFAVLRRPSLRLAFASLLVLLAVVQDARLYQRSHEHMHFQVVDWVTANVAPDIWIGAIQTGTIGFFHDRTINLDGKVNPDALKAAAEHRLRQYVLSSKVQYLPDWTGITDFVTWLSPEFEIIVNDPAANLAVLKRVR